MLEAIGRLGRDVVRKTPLAQPAQRALEFLRHNALRTEDFVPGGIHRFDRRSWVLKETEFGLRIWCSLDERSICRPILLNRYEPAETRFIAGTVRPGDFAVDAGANIGYHTLHIAQLAGPEGFVEAFEPLPYLADALQASIDENAFTARVAVRRLALDERAGSLRLRHAPQTVNFGGGYLAPDGAPPPDHADEAIGTVRLDDVAGERPCRFVKIDVEGAEPRVIRGAQATIARGRPVILAELHERQLRRVSDAGASDLIAQMANLGYGCARLNPNGSRGATLERYVDETPINVVFDPR